jgi:hypothetical protein
MTCGAATDALAICESRIHRVELYHLEVVVERNAFLPGVSVPGRFLGTGAVRGTEGDEHHREGDARRKAGTAVHLDRDRLPDGSAPCRLVDRGDRQCR